MSLKKQKAIKYIPIINFITMFCWIKTCAHQSIKVTDFLKNLLKIFIYSIFITVFRIAAFYIIDNQIINNIITCISIYFYFLVISSVSISAQEKILNISKKGK